MGFFVLLSFASFVLGVILVAIILYRHRERAARFLAFFLATLTSYSFFYFLFESRYLLYVPFLCRIGPVINFLTAPAMFFYIRFTLDNSARPKWRDLIHIIPALLLFADHLPFYIAGNEYKLKFIRSLYEHRENIFPSKVGWFFPLGVYYLTRQVLAFGYICYAVYLLSKSRRLHRVKNINPHTLRWIKTVLTVFFFFSLTGTIAYFFPNSPRASMATICEPVIIFVTLGIILLFNPSLLYGQIPDWPGRLLEKNKTLVLGSELFMQAEVGLREFMANEYFLRKNLKLKEVADTLGVQPYVLSAYINQEYRMRFNELINMHRIQYVKSCLAEKRWKVLTLEGIGRKAGFTNRGTFLTAFKKYTGTTPTDFLKEMDHVDNF